MLMIMMIEWLDDAYNVADPNLDYEDYADHVADQIFTYLLDFLQISQRYSVPLGMPVITRRVFLLLHASYWTCIISKICLIIN